VITNLNLNRVLFFILLVLISCYSCDKENKNEKSPVETEELPQPKPGAGKYASLLQNNRSLVSRIVSDTTYSSADGIEHSKISYINKQGEPMTIFLLTVDLSVSGVSIEVATPFDQPDFTRQTVRDMITYKNKSTQHVIGGVNGDYWDVSTPNLPSGTPLGLVYKNGMMIKELPDKNYYFLALLRDKTAVIGNFTKYQLVRTNIREALGGRYWLVQNRLNISEKLNTNVEPRTSVGVLNPQKVVFVIVDGRRPGYSVGISMQNLADLFLTIGATEAINMDGGGSTTYILKNNEGKFETINRPSDNSERSVANAWTIVSEN
jgi:exopolysaccharide biosynthesis protein